jgi:tetratricopeptide (TPR) repeat protein
MSRDLSQNERRLAALAAIGLLWAALLVAIGFKLVFVVAVVGGLLLIAAAALQGRAVLAAAGPRVHRARGRLVRVTGTASARVGRIDWTAKRHAAARRVAAAKELAAGGSRRALAAGGAAVAAVESRGQDVRRELAAKRVAAPAPAPGRREALRLNEQAAVLRSEERLDEALELSEQALAIFRTLRDTHGTALTLNALGLTQARIGDEAGALDSYESAVALLTDLGDGHGAGRVLANLGALHRGQGHDAQARAAWNDALERFEPGTPEHERMAQQLRIAS